MFYLMKRRNQRVKNKNKRFWCFKKIKMNKIPDGIYLYFKSLYFNSLLFLFMFFLYSLFPMIINIIAYIEINSTKNKLCILENNRCGLSFFGIGTKFIPENSFTKYENYIIYQSVAGVIFVFLWGIALLEYKEKEGN